jgi:hypothetical protein
MYTFYRSPNFRADLSEFLNGVDFSLDNFRDTLLSTENGQFDADALKDLFSLVDEEEHNVYIYIF